MMLALFSFIFLLPIWISFVYHDVEGLLLSSVAMGMSFCNHIYLCYRIGGKRRNIRIDTLFFYVCYAYMIYQAWNHIHFLFIGMMVLANAYLYYQLQVPFVDHYSIRQRRIHILLHVVGVSCFILVRWYPEWSTYLQSLYV